MVLLGTGERPVIFKSTHTITVLFEADSLEDAQSLISEIEPADLLREMDTGCMIGQVRVGETAQVPRRDVRSELEAVGNDGTFFDVAGSHTWGAYEARFDSAVSALKPAMQAALDSLPEGPVEVSVDRSSDDYALVATVESGGETLSITLRLSDAAEVGGEDEDGPYEPGEAGYLFLELIGEGGALVGNFAPDQYTDAAFALYGDDSAWEAKVSAMREALQFGLAEKVQEWIDERK